MKNIFEGKVFQEPTVDDFMKRERPVYFDRTLIFDLDTFFTKDEQEQIRERARKDPVDAMKNMLETNPPDPEKYLEITDQIENYIQRIQSRGGKVIIVNFPFSGQLWELNEKAFPKKDFWNIFTSRTSAKTIHFKDYPSLSNFICPDGSHLDLKDMPSFIEALVKIIFENNK